MTTRILAVVAILAVALVAAWVFRYDIELRQEGSVVVRLDRWTGNIAACGLPDSDTRLFDC